MLRVEQRRWFALTACSLLPFLRVPDPCPTARWSSCREKVVAESEQVFGPDAPPAGPLPSIEELRGLQFTEACLRETLRKYRY